jgi:ribosomal protein S18 acetylase RimI-like enzyme
VKIERMTRLIPAALEAADFSVSVTEEAIAPFDGPGLITVVKLLVPYVKTYPRDGALYVEADPAQRMIAVVKVGMDVVGYVAVLHAWNECAQIDDIMISRSHRGIGLGRSLMDEAVKWAKEHDLSIVRLETQTTNVPACRFYQRYGFKLGGFDRHLYDALPSGSKRETALFWYLHLA